MKTQVTQTGIAIHFVSNMNRALRDIQQSTGTGECGSAPSVDEGGGARRPGEPGRSGQEKPICTERPVEGAHVHAQRTGDRG